MYRLIACLEGGYGQDFAYVFSESSTALAALAELDDDPDYCYQRRESSTYEESDSHRKETITHDKKEHVYQGDRDKKYANAVDDKTWQAEAHTLQRSSYEHARHSERQLPHYHPDERNTHPDDPYIRSEDTQEILRKNEKDE